MDENAGVKEQKVRGSTATDRKEAYLMKELIIERVDVRAAPIKDEPGGLTNILSACGMQGWTSNSSLLGGRRTNPAKRLFLFPRCAAIVRSGQPVSWDLM